MLKTKLWKSYFRQISPNSTAEATMPSGESPYWKRMRSAREPWFTPIRRALPCSLSFMTSGAKASSMAAWASWMSSSFSSLMVSKDLRPSAKFPGFTRTLSTKSAHTRATFGVKWISATSGVLYPSSRSRRLMCSQALASRMPWTVMRTMSTPASAHFLTCATVASTSWVRVVVIVCVAMGCSEPTGTSPMYTVRVLRRTQLSAASQ
mmetsp:Transcript_12121/g.38266  ORF Transcript_12121/g.38266 Transcript_12121/m.38266 type:complete len:207 (-) Transcript_12121:20-640(-)